MLVNQYSPITDSVNIETLSVLKKSNLLKNKHDRIVSAKKHATAKKEKRLVKAGYLTKKGKFGAVKSGKTSKRRSSRKRRTTKKR